MGVVLLDGGGDPPAVCEQHGYRCAGGCQGGMDLCEADRPSEVRRHPAGRDPPHDRGRVSVHDLGGFRRDDRGIVGLEADQDGKVVPLVGGLQLG